MNSGSNQVNKKANGNSGIAVVIVLVIFLICVILAVAHGTFTGEGNDAEKSTAAVAEETTTAPAATEDKNLSKKINLTDNYAFSLPEGAEFYDSPEGEGFSKDTAYIIDEGNTVIRSFLVEDEPDCFPGLVEYFYEDTDTEPGYSGFFDTALATAEDIVGDADGNAMNRISYFWPDGESTLCCICIMSYDDCSKLASKLLRSVRYNGESQSAFYKSHEEYANASEAPWGYTYEPSAVEIDQAMLKEAQEAEMNQHDYWDESHCYPFF